MEVTVEATPMQSHPDQTLCGDNWPSTNIRVIKGKVGLQAFLAENLL